MASEAEVEAAAKAIVALDPYLSRQPDEWQCHIDEARAALEAAEKVRQAANMQKLDDLRYGERDPGVCGLD